MGKRNKNGEFLLSFRRRKQLMQMVEEGFQSTYYNDICMATNTKVWMREKIQNGGANK